KHIIPSFEDRLPTERSPQFVERIVFLPTSLQHDQSATAIKATHEFTQNRLLQFPIRQVNQKPLTNDEVIVVVAIDLLQKIHFSQNNIVPIAKSLSRQCKPCIGEIDRMYDGPGDGRIGERSLTFSASSVQYLGICRESTFYQLYFSVQQMLV